MRLRYYLRGLGIGIVVTALIMGMTTEAGRPLTDAEIRAKALTLGMVDAENRNLMSVGGGSASPESGQGSPESPAPQGTPGGGQDPDTPLESPEIQDTAEPEDSLSPQPAETPTSSPTPTAGSTPTVSPTPSPALSPTPQVTASPAAVTETVTIRIVRGDSSYTVSRRLEEAGLVDSASEYDAYLVDNGYSKTIRTGTYQIPVGATWEEIAKMIA